ncbi:hypothetical protein MP228_002352 [Amoeboaphelidium protococcarum]|nr:hypothetical protein MP228_002352 [Amoeboaphelidium protococcarum]
MATARRRHIGVLKSMMNEVIRVQKFEKELFFYKVKLSDDLTTNDEWMEFSRAVGESKDQSDKKHVLIWNNAAGFSESLNTLHSACEQFDYLAYYDWELTVTDIRQRLHFVPCNVLQQLVQQLRRVYPSKDDLGVFLSVENFARACKVTAIKKFCLGNSLQFLKQMIVQNSNIRRRNCSRGRQVWMLLVNEIPEDSDDETFYKQ